MSVNDKSFATEPTATAARSVRFSSAGHDAATQSHTETAMPIRCIRRSSPPSPRRAGQSHRVARLPFRRRACRVRKTPYRIAESLTQVCLAGCNVQPNLRVPKTSPARRPFWGCLVLGSRFYGAAGKLGQQNVASCVDSWSSSSPRGNRLLRSRFEWKATNRCCLATISTRAIRTRIESIRCEGPVIPPDVEWRLIIALARYGGLRIPSELLSLPWSEVDWEAGTFIGHSKKTERYANSGIRVCPIFPEPRPFLEAAREAAEPGAKYVISRYRKSNANLRTEFKRIIKRAGLEPWPKLFHDRRATRQTKLLGAHPAKAVCDWMGNSQKTAMEHYAQVTVEHVRRAATTPTGPIPILPQEKRTAESEALAKQNAQQHTAALGSMVTQAVGERVKNPENLQVCASTCRSVRESKMTPTGLEHTAKSSEMTGVAGQGGAESGALGAQSGHFHPALVDADLASVIAAWPGLSADDRAAVLGIVRRAAGDAGDARGA
ncbi:MAG: hypothetical protein DCC68_15530 [Planctomycetota bacterium]|nr:MAG: hypothetical protein DCC68_15530 [Planctomycetota bacterium]